MRPLALLLVGAAATSATAQGTFDPAPFLSDIARYGASCTGYALGYAKLTEDDDGIAEAHADLAQLAAETGENIDALRMVVETHALRYQAALALVLPHEDPQTAYPAEVDTLRGGMSDCQDADRSRLMLEAGQDQQRAALQRSDTVSAGN